MTKHNQWPFMVQWKIKEHDLAKIKNDGMLVTKPYDIHFGGKFHLSFFANRYDRSLIVINVNGCLMPVECKAKVTIESANFSSDVSFFINKRPNQDQVRCCEAKDLFDIEKKFIVDGELIVKIVGTFTPECSKDSKNFNAYGKRIKILGDVLWERDDKDFVITVDNKDIKSNKHILVAHSPVFEAMFQSGMKEANENKMTIPNYSFEVVEAIIKLCYDIEISGELICKQYEKFFEFADQYQMDRIRPIVEACLIKSINVTNVCILLNSSIVLDNSKLFNKCYRFLENCMNKKEAVMDLEILDKDTALKLFKNAFHKDACLQGIEPSPLPPSPLYSTCSPSSSTSGWYRRSPLYTPCPPSESPSRGSPLYSPT